MRLAPYRPRPGIQGPSRKAAIGALCVAAIMGFYGYATSVQKAATLRSAGGAGSAIAEDDSARPAVGVAPTPTLVFAVTDKPATQLAAAKPLPAPSAAAVEAAEPAAETPVTETAAQTVETAEAAAPPPMERTERAAFVSQPVPEAAPDTLSVPTAPLAVPPPAASALDQGAPVSALETAPATTP